MTVRAKQLVGGAFVIVLVALIGHNAYWTVRNRREMSCGYVPCVQPRDLARVAEADEHPVVAGRFANYHYLAKRIGGATVTVPAWMTTQDQLWHLQRVARLHVVVSQTPLEVAPAQVRGLTRGTRTPRRWLRERRRGKDIWKALHVRFDRSATRYVLAETPESRGPLFLLPESQYLDAAAARP